MSSFLVSAVIIGTVHTHSAMLSRKVCASAEGHDNARYKCIPDAEHLFCQIKVPYTLDALSRR